MRKIFFMEMFFLFLGIGSVSRNTYSQTYLIKGNVSTIKEPMKNVEVTFINITDTLKIFSAITDIAGNYQLNIISSEDPGTTLPTTFEYSQNYPNPFSNETVIQYKLNKTADVSVKIYNVLGQEIKNITLGTQQIGVYSITWDGRDNSHNKTSTGIYFYQLRSKNETLVKKMIKGINVGLSNMIAFNNSFEYKSELQKKAAIINEEAPTFRVWIKNTNETRPRIITKEFQGITVRKDTVINFVVQEAENVFAIYFLKDTTITIGKIQNINLNDLELADKPWLIQDDIEFYDWSSHCIYLKKDKSNFFPGFDTTKKTLEYLYRLSWAEKPLIAVANSKKCYVSYFLSSLSSFFWLYPEITDFNIFYYPKDVIYTEWPYPFANDVRNNEYVKNALDTQNLLHEGLNITIDSLWIDNGDTATVRYKITINNNDADNLYVLDPDKMGTGLFHCFTNGPIFYNLTNSTPYESRYKIITYPSLGTYESKWFTKIEGGKSINRIIILKGYPRLSDGNYHCRFNYPSIYSISKEERMLSDGRYWLGPTRSELIGFYLGVSGKIDSQKISSIKIKQVNCLNIPLRK